jgi:hypothetical protein
MRLFKRTGIIAAALVIAVLLLVLTQSTSSRSSYKLSDYRNGAKLPQGHKSPKLPACINENSTHADTWASLKSKHAHLMADKFTYVVPRRATLL